MDPAMITAIAGFVIAILGTEGIPSVIKAIKKDDKDAPTPKPPEPLNPVLTPAATQITAEALTSLAVQLANAEKRHDQLLAKVYMCSVPSCPTRISILDQDK